MGTTIRDVARAAEVSIGTVSRALKNQPGLTEATRARVTEVARAMGYDMGQLRQSRIRRVVFVLHRQHNTLASTPFYSPVLHGVEEACREEGIALSFVALGPAEPVLAQIRLHGPDAILCAGFFEPELLAALQASGKPMVLIDMHQPGFISANPDHRLGGMLATRHLLQQGRKRIAMLSGSHAHYSIRERVYGFHQALFEARMLADPALEITLPDTREESTQQAMRQLLSLPQPPDALFCYNDSTALVAMRCCQDAGLRVPDGISITGFDDIAAAAHAHPPLTTLHIEKETLGIAGVELLLHGSAAEPVEQVLPVQFVLRASSQR
jgi:DNA-binding LacI/PurR family transcriptional regulator